MIKSRTLWTPSVVLASFLLAFNVASHAASGDHSDGKCDKEKKHGAFNGHHHSPEARFLQHKLSKLDLSVEQKAQVKAIFDKQQSIASEKRQAARDGYKSLLAASGSDAYDEKNVQQLANDQARIQADLLVLRTNAMHEVYQVLTPEQKEKWAEYQSRIKAKRQGNA